MSGARGDLVALPGRLLWSALVEPTIPPGGSKKRYQAKIQMSKDAPEFEQLWQTVEKVAVDTWGEAIGKERIGKLQHAIETGMDARISPISIQDGDLFDPQYNAGFWLIQATRRENQGPPQILGPDGLGVPSTDEFPDGGDGVLLLVNVWAQQQYERVNFSLEAVRLIIHGEPIGGPPKEAIAAGVAAISRMAVPTSLPGVKPVQQIGAGPAAAAPTNSPGARPGAFGRTVQVEEPKAATTVVSSRRRGLMDLK